MMRLSGVMRRTSENRVSSSARARGYDRCFRHQGLPTQAQPEPHRPGQ